MPTKKSFTINPAKKHLVPLKASVLNLIAQQQATGSIMGVLSLQDAVVTYIENNFTTASLPDLARQYHFSPNHLSHLIRRYTGTSFRSLYKQVKMDRAKQLVENPRLSILQITLQLNYASTRVFSKAFKNTYAVTPRIYRKNYFA